MINQNLPAFGSHIPAWGAAADQAQMINNIFDSSMQARQYYNANYDSNQASKIPMINLLNNSANNISGQLKRESNL